MLYSWLERNNCIQIQSVSPRSMSFTPEINMTWLWRREPRNTQGFKLWTLGSQTETSNRAPEDPMSASSEEHRPSIETWRWDDPFSDENVVQGAIFVRSTHYHHSEKVDCAIYDHSSAREARLTLVEQVPLPDDALDEPLSIGWLGKFPPIRHKWCAWHGMRTHNLPPCRRPSGPIPS
jgi:hypothetical protein